MLLRADAPQVNYYTNPFPTFYKNEKVDVLHCSAELKYILQRETRKKTGHIQSLYIPREVYQVKYIFL